MAEGQSFRQAVWNTNNMLESTFRELNSWDFQLYLTGDNNFRYKIYPEYKANRLRMVRPEYLEDVKAHLVRELGARVSDGCEADDELGIEQCLSQDTIIVSIDKDLNMVPGWNYNPRKKERKLVSPTDGIRFFFHQLLTGDTADNLKGVVGIGKVKAERILQEISGEQELLETVRGCYSNDMELEMNAHCLWIWRKPNDNVVERWKELGYQASEC